MLAVPASFMIAVGRVRIAAMTWGPLPVRAGPGQDLPPGQPLELGTQARLILFQDVVRISWRPGTRHNARRRPRCPGRLDPLPPGSGGWWPHQEARTAGSADRGGYPARPARPAARQRPTPPMAVNDCAPAITAAIAAARTRGSGWRTPRPLRRAGTRAPGSPQLTGPAA